MDSRYCFSHTRAAQDLHKARLLVGKRLSALMHDQYYFNGEDPKLPFAKDSYRPILLKNSASPD